MDEVRKCVFSDSTENLNTSMKVKLPDETVVEVWISDEFAEDATPKLAREAYLRKHPPEEPAEMKKLREMAAKMGFSLVGANEMPAEPQAHAIALPPTTNRLSPPPLPKTITEAAQPKPLIDPNNRIVTGRMADSKDLNIRVNLADSKAAEAGAPQGQYSVSTQSKPSEDLKEGEYAEIGQVAGRAGIAIAIPVRRVGKSGTTNIRVVENGGDPGLQRRFKDMANASKSEQGVVYGRDGYDSRTARCPLCATKVNPTCKKCNGLGEIEINKQR